MYQSETAPWLEFYAWNTDGTAKTDLVYNTAGISIVVVRDNLANSAALTLADASGPTDWAAGKFWAMGGNKYRVGIATASISSFTGQISVEGTYTGGVITGVTREVSAYNPAGNPMATYTQPTGFLAASFPTDPADQSAVEAAITAAQVAIIAQVDANETKIDSIQSDTNDIQTRLPAALESGRIAAALDSATATQIDNIEATLTTLGSESTTVERSVSDTNAITFSWPVSGATITGTASLNNGTYGAVAGAIAFLRTETGKHYYTLAHNAADRPSAEGQVRYKFVDGTYTGYVVLRTVTTVLGASQPDYAPALAATALSTTQWTNTLAANLGTTNTTVATNLNATVSSRSTQTSVDTIDDLLDTEIPALTAAVAAEAVKTSAIKAKTDNLPTDPADQSLVEAAITAATSPLATPAQVNAEVVDVLSVDTFGELGSPPAATSSLKDKLVWLFMWARNKSTATATERKLYADDVTTIVSTETITDNGTTFTKGESL